MRGLLVVEGGIDGLGVRVLGPGTGRVWMRGLQIKDDGERGRSGLMLGVRGVLVEDVAGGDCEILLWKVSIVCYHCGKSPAH